MTERRQPRRTVVVVGRIVIEMLPGLRRMITKRSTSGEHRFVAGGGGGADELLQGLSGGVAVVALAGERVRRPQERDRHAEQQQARGASPCEWVVAAADPRAGPEEQHRHEDD